jgi:glycosyltransferase involved in cell wall biosynthesis
VKDLQTLVRSTPQLVRRHPELKVEVAGRGPERTRLEALARELGVSEAIRFLGWREPATVLRRWSVFVTPSLHEGLPLASLEAMAAGVPVVAAATGGLCELVDDGVTGFLVPPRDANALARRVDQLLCDPALRDDMSRRAVQRVAARFSEQRMAREVGGIYEQMLSGWGEPTLRRNRARRAFARARGEKPRWIRGHNSTGRSKG